MICEECGSDRPLKRNSFTVTNQKTGARFEYSKNICKPCKMGIREKVIKQMNERQKDSKRNDS